ncbi:hypothetical protein OSB04_003060 [Centaurea solstitialis]|uniref:CCHC-type domain-containing protein n=1 Tax=Centaurea solstitialis TaxID=347529 RepID=A0AA38WV33_9ASTR|nr:hypothetical protein OSB04_003060 [Centaurea solstitialis]
MALQAKDNYFDTGSAGKPPRFNKDNFSLWKTRMELFLSGSDPQIPYFLENGPHVPTQIVHPIPAAGGQPAVPERQLVKPVTDWNDEDRRLVNIDTKARSLIAMSLPDDVFHSVCHLRSAKEIWDTLCVQYEGTAVLMESRKIFLVRQYESFIHQKDETLSQLHQRFNCLLIDLKTIGTTYSNSEVVTKFMEALPEHWEIYTSCLTMSKDIKTLTLSELYGILLNREQQKKLKKNLIRDSKESKSTSVALVSDSVPPVAATSSSVTITELESSDSDMSEDPEFNESLALLTRSFKKFAKKGNFHKKKHLSITDKPKSDPVDKATAICYNCQGKGHFANDCRYRKSQFAPSSAKSSSKNPKYQRLKEKYKKMKTQRKGKGLIAEDCDWDDVSSDDSSDEEDTQVALMAIIEEPMLALMAKIEEVPEEIPPQDPEASSSTTPEASTSATDSSSQVPIPLIPLESLTQLDLVTLDLYKALNGKTSAEKMNIDLRGQLKECQEKLKQLTIMEENYKDQVTVNKTLCIERELALAAKEKALAQLNAEKVTIKGWSDASEKVDEILASGRPDKSKRGLGFTRGYKKDETKCRTQVFRIGKRELKYQLKFSESEIAHSPNRRTLLFRIGKHLFSESENESLTRGLALEKFLSFPSPLFRTHLFRIGKVHFPKMSKEILGIGSETRPPVLVMGEYQQWKRRMIHFLDMLDGNLMKSIREGPIRPTVTVAAVPKTDTCPELPSYVVEKPVEMFSPEQRARHLVDKRALTLLIMALPNDMYARVDSLTNARDVWLEIEQQMQGGDTALESQKESALNAYEGFKARETESLTESYQRLNAFVNDLRRLGIEKSKYEVNVKFLKNLTSAWQNLAINLQLSRNLGIMGLHDLFSMMVQHEEFITGGKFKNTVDPLALAAVPCGGSNSAPFQHQQYNNSSPQQYNQSPPQHYQENYNQEVNGNYGSNYPEFNSNYSSSYQYPDDPLIISISDDELFHVNESLALISNSVQKLNSKRGYSRPRGSGYPSGGRMGQGRGGHYQQERVQFGNQGRGGYQQGDRYQNQHPGRYRGDQGQYREARGNYRDNTYLDYQGGSGDQGDWRGQVSHINYRQNQRNYTPESGYIDRQGYSSGYEGGQDGRREDGRYGGFVGGQSGPGYGQEQERNYREYDGQSAHGNRNYQDGNHQSGSSRQAPREGHQQGPVEIGDQRLNAPPAPVNSGSPNPAPQKIASATTSCFKCGKLGHYASNCPVRFKDAAYFEKKAALMRKKEKGVALLVDEENWVCEEESSDEEDHLVGGPCLMADFEGPEAVGPSTYRDLDASEVSTIPDLTDDVTMLESRICELERCLQSERSLVTKFRIDSAIYKSSLEDLTIVYNRETLESSVRESNLSNKLSCLQKTHEELNSDHGELQLKFQLLSEERTRLFSKIQELEDNNFKRGQSEQTLSILTQHANKNPFYKARPGLGLFENHVLEKAPSHLYNFEDMAASKPKPAFIGGHVTEEFIRQTVTYTEVINGETITRTISPSNSSSSSPPSSPVPNKPIFVPASDPTNTKST